MIREGKWHWLVPICVGLGIGALIWSAIAGDLHLWMWEWAHGRG